MNMFFIILFILITAFSQGAEYKLSSPPIERIRGDSAVGFNDNGQILFSHSPNGRLELFFTGCLLDENGERNSIDFPNRNEFFDVNLFPKMINNDGIVLGIVSSSSKKGGIGGSKPFIWMKGHGLIDYNLVSINANHYTVDDLNDAGWFVGHYHTEDHKVRPYLCKSSKCISDMGEKSEFWMHFGKLGYYVTDIHLSAINNSGQLAGWFSYGRYDIQNKKYITIGHETFFWDSSLIHVIPLPYSFQIPPTTIKLNNTGSVILRFAAPKAPYEMNSTFLWNNKVGIQELKGINGDQISDSDVIIGKNAQGVPAVWKNGLIHTVSQISSEDEPDARPVNVESFIDINSKDQILSTGFLFGRQVFFIIESLSK